MAGYHVFNFDGMPMRNDGRANVTCPQWMVDKVKAIAAENHCFQSDIYRQAIYEWLCKRELEGYRRKKQGLRESDSITRNGNTAALNLSLEIPRELMKC